MRTMQYFILLDPGTGMESAAGSTTCSIQMERWLFLLGNLNGRLQSYNQVANRVVKFQNVQLYRSFRIFPTWNKWVTSQWLTSLKRLYCSADSAMSATWVQLCILYIRIMREQKILLLPIYLTLNVTNVQNDLIQIWILEPSIFRSRKSISDASDDTRWQHHSHVSPEEAPAPSNKLSVASVPILSENTKAKLSCVSPLH